MYDSDHQDILTAAGAGDVDETAAVLSMDNRLTRATDAEGRTPLHLAAQAGHHAIVALLLHNNADPQALDRAGRTAAELADTAGHAAVAALIRTGGR